MKPADKWIYIGSFLCAAVGLLGSFWPLIVLGVMAAMLCGRWFFGLLLALLFDLVLGPPTGILYFVYFPLVVLALLCFVARYLALRFVLKRGGTDTL